MGVFIELVAILLLFYALVFWPWGLCDLSSLTRDWIPATCIGRWSLNPSTTREIPYISIKSFIMSMLFTTWTGFIVTQSRRLKLESNILFLAKELENHWQHFKSYEHTQCQDLGFYTILHQRKLSSSEKRQVPGLRQINHKMSQDYLVPEIWEVLKEWRDYIKRTQKPPWRGSHWPKLR